jgi:endonuclease/exonuclease/phosphatase family metal-dependent hydrolase
MIGRMIAALLLASLAPVSIAQEAKKPAPARLRVLTYNIHHGEGADNKLDLERIAKVIKSTDPDLVALQEVDRRTTRTLDVDQAAKLGELTGMHAYFAKAMDFQGGGYGDAILSKQKPLATRTFPLPADKGFEPRALGEARIQIGDTTIVFYATHLDHTRDSKQRLMQIKEIEKVAAQEKEPLVLLAGDLNAQPASAEIETLLKSWKDATARPDLKTFPADKPRIKIDYVLYRPTDRIKVIEAQVIEEKVASDHAPLLVVFEIER